MNDKRVPDLSFLFSFLILMNACASTQSPADKELLSGSAIAHSGIKVPVAVVAFENKAASSDRDDCRGWFDYPTLGSAFSERLISALAKYEKFDILERDTIREIYENEHNLVNSKPVPKSEQNQFERARYVLAGVVTSFELCADSANAGAVLGTFTGWQSGSINYGNAKVDVTLRAIDTRTGRVVATAKGQGVQNRGGFSLGGGGTDGSGGLGFGGKSPLGNAIDLAIAKALKELEPKLQI